MKKLKIISIFFIAISIIFLMKNSVNAEQYDLNIFAHINQVSYTTPFEYKAGYVGSKIYLNYEHVYGTNVIYCVAHGKKMRKAETLNFTIKNYVELNGTKATGSNGTVVENPQNAVLAGILGGGLYPTGYGTGPKNYAPAQQALYKVWDDWIDTVGTPAFGLSMFNNRASNASYNSASANAYLQQVQNKVALGQRFAIGVFFLIDESAPNYQELIFVTAIPFDDEPTPNIVIDKVDASSNVRLSRVSFILKSNSKNQYIETINNGTVTYTSDESKAYVFTTGVSSYQSIVISGLESGDYTIKETQNLNNGYNNSSNIGLEKVFNYTANTSLNVVIPNSSIIITDDDPDEPDEPDPDPGTGNITVSGTVWEDLLDGKSNTNNSKKDSGEKGIAGVKVYWKDSSGTNIASTITDSNGYYKMASEITIPNHEYDSRNPTNTSKYSRLNNSYIEFEYNGLKYTTVSPSTSGTDTSKGTEIADIRTSLDSYFDEINSQGVIDNNQLKYRLSYNTSENNKAVLNQSNTDFAVRANTKLTGVNNILDNADTHDYKYVCYDEWECYHSDEDSDWSHTVHNRGERKSGWHKNNLNLGLVLREQPDLAIVSDIDQVRVLMKDQEYIYEYNNRNIADNTNVTNYCVSFEKKYTPGVYTRPVNPSDIAYIQNQDNYGGDLQVYVTYVMRVKNQSNTLPITVKELVNYYDSNYELTYNSYQWSSSAKYGDTYNKDGYKSVYTTQLENTILQPGQISDSISIEYRVLGDSLKSLINKDDGLTIRNVSEINVYTTFYGGETQCAENKKASEIGKANLQYAGVDIDSAPGNATPGKPERYEDDTDEAPNFKLIKNDEYKIISGTVWEDTQTAESKNKNERLGNGIKEGNENTIANVRVELIRADYNETAKIYRIENGEAKTYDAITYTDSNGNYKFEGMVTDNYIIKYTYGNDTSVLLNGSSKINNQHEINARNYKSTIITQEPVKSAIDNNGDDQWHLTLRNNASIATDDLTERLSKESLQYSNFNNPINMTAYSTSFAIQVEYDKDGDQFEKVDEDGGNFENDIGIFDFGIIERAREDIVIDKTIDNLKITLANGQILTEGNPYRDKMNYVKALGTTDIAQRKQSLDANAKLLYLEMDSEYIQGSRIDIRYAITVTNNNEIDYEYDSDLGGNERYYYYGEVNSPKIKPSVELVVDYVDSELTCTTENENNKNWAQVQAQQLKDSGLISEATFNTIKPEAGNYLIFVTEIFKNLASGESHTEYLFATKLLANQANDYTYENHTEILKLNGKIARNIDSTESTGKQVTKTYKPGTYIPSLARVKATYTTARDSRNSGKILTDGAIERVGLHNQDDDMITIRITPPTGIDNNIIMYIVIGVISLIVISGGIYFIKKKVL